jgi:hypothetical protein
MAFKMFNFKNFFVRNHNTDFILEANRGDTPESSILLDEEDLDFLYQIDYKNWTYAISTRYEVLLDELKNRDSVRKLIEAQFVKEFNSIYKSKEDRENISLDSFVDFVNKFASNFNDYGEKVNTSIDDKSKFKNWEKYFREEYGEDFDRVKKKSSREFFHDLRFYISSYIVPFVKEKKAYPLRGLRGRSSVIVPMHVNRLIQKLETTKGEEITLPSNNNKLLNLSRVLSQEVPIEMKKTGAYGFDLGRPRTQNIPLGPDRSTALGKTRGFTFPSTEGSKSIKDLIRRLAKFNYQRHMGPLPSDENFKKFSGVDDDGNPLLTYRFFKIKRNLEDTFNYDVIKKRIFKKIFRFISNNRELRSWSQVRDHGLFDIIDIKFQNEIESGRWATSSKSMTDYIIKNKSSLVSTSSKDSNDSKNASDYVSIWSNISGNRMILTIFAEHFAEKQLDHMLESGNMLRGPRILDGDDEESRRKNYSRLDPESKKELEKNLSSEDLEKFIKTGRLPLNLKNIGNKKKLVPGNMSYSPVVLPFFKTRIVGVDGTEQEINVPLIKPGRYLSGLSGMSDNEDDEDKDKDKDEDKDEDDSILDFEEEGEEGLKDPFSSPSTSDRTSVYILKSDAGEEKEVKVIDASSSDRYVKKSGVGGVYYSIDTKGESRKFGFNRWKKSDKNAFVKVWSHPEYNQIFSLSNVRSKYKQLFGSNVVDIYDDIDPFVFYPQQDLPEGYPFILNGYKIGDADMRYSSGSSSDDSIERGPAARGDDVGAIQRSLANLGLKILRSDSNPEIMGFPMIIKAINDCLSMKSQVCNNDGNQGFRVWLLDDPQRIQDLHDDVVAEVMRGGNSGIWKTFIGVYGDKKGPNHVFCSIIGKFLQADSRSRRKIKSSLSHGQVGRKSRKNLIGALSVASFNRDLANYVDMLEKKSKSPSQSNNFTSNKVLNSISSVKVLGDDDDDKIVEWFYPGYSNAQDKGKFHADKENFRPDVDDWRFGPNTELRDFIRRFYDIDKTKITQEQKNTLLEKIKEEKSFLVGDGSTTQGVIGTDSYIFNQSIFDEIPEGSSLSIRKQIESIHNYTNQIYEKDISYISEISIKKVSDDKFSILSDESDPQVRDFKQKIYEVSPFVNKLIKEVIKINNVPNSQISTTFNKLINFMNSPQTSNENFTQNINVLYYILSNNKISLLNSYSLFLESIKSGVTSQAETLYVRKYRDSNTKSFFSSLDYVSDLLRLVAFKFKGSIDDILNKIKQDENYSIKVSNFIRDLKNKNLISPEAIDFFKSYLFRPGGLSASEVQKVPTYFDPLPKIQEIKEKTSRLIRSYGSTLRRIDIVNILTNYDFSNIDKFKTSEIINIINSRKDLTERSNIARRLKDYYVKNGDWQYLDPDLKSFIDSTQR